MTYSFRSYHGPGVDSAPSENEYQEYFPGVKAAGAEGWQPYHLHVPIVLKSGSLNLLEPSGPVQAYTGIALPLTQGSDVRLWLQVLKDKRYHLVVWLETEV